MAGRFSRSVLENQGGRAKGNLDFASWRCIVLSMVFMFLMVFWALALVFHFSGMVISMVLVLTLVVLLLKLIIRRTSFN
jgi:hypothetical protein